MIRIIAVSLLSLGLPWVAMAEEHPEHPHAQEHPAGKEHPKEKEHPKGKAQSQGKEHPKHEHPVGSVAWNKQMSQEYTKTVQNHVKEAKASGGFKIRDAKLGKEWNLSLVRVHKNKVVHLGNDQFFACADFRSAIKGDRSKVDLDFYATKSGNDWKIDKVLIHKVNGKPRYTYNDKNERVPVK
ncbi:MAG: hypothetical protein HY401_00885 [Elusimicrobia bacterium]|nr:hypothetical protein [Elusimicrobiota bacterium]